MIPDAEKVRTPDPDDPKGTIVIDETLIAPIVAVWFEQEALFVRALLWGPLPASRPADRVYAIFGKDATLWCRGRVKQLGWPELRDIDSIEVTVTETIPGKWELDDEE